MYKTAHHVYPSAELTQDGRSSILAAIRAELRRTVEEEDFGVKHLHRIKTLAENAQRMLGGALEAIDHFGALVPGTGGIAGSMTSLDPVGPVEFSSLTPAQYGENAGAKLVQELLAFAKNFTGKSDPKPSHDLVLAGLFDARKLAGEAGDPAMIDRIDQMTTKYLEQMVSADTANQETVP